MATAGLTVSCLSSGSIAQAGSPVPASVRLPQLLTKPFIADTLQEVVRTDRKGTIMLDFLVSRDVSGTFGRTSLVVSGLTCGPDASNEVTCSSLGSTSQVISDAAFAIDAKLTSARLRTTWLGYPLAIDWTRERGMTMMTGKIGVMLSSPSFAIENFQNIFTRATTRFLDRRVACRPDTLAGLTTGDAAQREPSNYLETSDELTALVPMMRSSKAACANK